MDFEDYLKAEEANLQQIRRLPAFSSIIPLVNRLYDLSIKLIPPGTSNIYGRLLLLCHKCFLSATSLIGRGLPDDASPVIRRAIEIAKVALALNFDREENVIRWASFEQRMDRWAARKAGEKPRGPRPPKLKLPENHEALEELRSFEGIYSDSDVHFTPEYFATREWEVRGDELFLNYFTSDQRSLERAIVLLTATHRDILIIFDECMGGAFKINEEWKRLDDQLVINGQRFSQQFESLSR